jgi:hypothetical protein
MGKARISIGVGSGERANMPKGPYITAEDDGTRPRREPAAKDISQTADVSRTETEISRESELGSDTAGGEPRGHAPTGSHSTQRPDIPDDLAERPKGPAQPGGRHRGT